MQRDLSLLLTLEGRTAVTAGRLSTCSSYEAAQGMYAVSRGLCLCRYVISYASRHHCQHVVALEHCTGCCRMLDPSQRLMLLSRGSAYTAAGDTCDLSALEHLASLKHCSGLTRELRRQELILFSRADLERSIPSMVDGFKPGQRKIMFACFKRNLKKDIKVQLSRLRLHTSCS